MCEFPLKTVGTKRHTNVEVIICRVNGSQRFHSPEKAMELKECGALEVGLGSLHSKLHSTFPPVIPLDQKWTNKSYATGLVEE